MKRKREEAASGGIGVAGLLGVIFVTLKLLGVEPVATWSWWWVTAPLWVALAIAALICICVLIFLVTRKVMRHFRFRP